mgnify:CR=1 FL=1
MCSITADEHKKIHVHNLNHAVDIFLLFLLVVSLSLALVIGSCCCRVCDKVTEIHLLMLHFRFFLMG